MPMRPVRVRLSAAGFSDWIPLNRMSNSFGIGLGVELSSNGNLTYSVQHTFDDIYEEADRPLSRSTTSLTVNKVNHGLSTSDWVKIAGSPIWDGQYAVASVTDQDNFVVTVANSGVTSGIGRIQTARVFNHETLVSQTARADGNYQFPPRACRLIVSSYTAGYVDLNMIAAGK